MSKPVKDSSNKAISEQPAGKITTWAKAHKFHCIGLVLSLVIILVIVTVFANRDASKDTDHSQSGTSEKTDNTTDEIKQILEDIEKVDVNDSLLEELDSYSLEPDNQSQ